MIQTVSAQTLKQWLDKNAAVLIDVREPQEYEEGHIKGAILMPLSTVNAGELPDLEGRKLVMHCKGGGRSSRACAKLMAEDSGLAPYNLEGGITAWAEAGYEVEK
jgi:rhodanese-related sulfurtransferase